MCWKKILSRICYKFGWYRPKLYIDRNIVANYIKIEFSIVEDKS